MYYVREESGNDSEAWKWQAETELLLPEMLAGDAMQPASAIHQPQPAPSDLYARHTAAAGVPWRAHAGSGEDDPTDANDPCPYQETTE